MVQFYDFLKSISFKSVELNCGDEIAENITYWDTPNAMARTMIGECGVTVCKVNPKIIQLRLDFTTVNAFDSYIAHSTENILLVDVAGNTCDNPIHCV